jgi:hypothetical protein
MHFHRLSPRYVRVLCALKGSGSRADLTTARSEGFPEPEIEKARRSEPCKDFGLSGWFRCLKAPKIQHLHYEKKST